MLAALGWSEASLAILADRYQQAVAQPAQRKLALLVGINQYPETVCDYTPVRGMALTGCLTDIELQRELLVHRFGFQPDDILTLTDQAATHQGIVAAFNQLSQQSRAGDLVLFHFSGLGSRVQLEGSQPQVWSSLVPVDGNLPTADNPLINDLMLDTVGHLLNALPTQQTITILDAGYTRLGRTTQGNLRIRSRPDAPMGTLAPREVALQEALSPGKSKLPGIVLQASAPDQIATEAQWSGFSAGLFTYALTQQLWCSTPATTLWVSFAQATTTVRQTAGLKQQPTQSQQPQKPAQAKLLLTSAQSAGADGVIQAVEDDGKVRLWLAGLPAAVLENSSGSLFATVGAAVGEQSGSNQSGSGQSRSLVQLRTRDGLTAKARPLQSTSPLQPGQLVQEAVRIIPRHVGLTVALDNSLERIERVDATSAFAAIPRVSSVLVGEQPADYLFGKTQPAALVASGANVLLQTQLTKDTPTNNEITPANGYGLFYLDRNAIPNTLTQSTEAIKTAINRLTPQLKALLAIKLLRLTQNQGSSRLKLRVVMETAAGQQLQDTLRTQTLPATSPGESPTITAGSQVQYRLENHNPMPIYFTLIGMDTRGNPLMLSPTPDQIAAGETITVPTGTGWSIQPPAGLAETHLIFSRAPFTQTAELFGATLIKANAQQVTALPNPLEMVQAVLQDLHQASSASIPIEIPADAYALDVTAWATLSFIYPVVEA